MSGLLSDYKNMRHNFNMEKGTNTATVRMMLEKEFSAAIGFHRRYQANQSIIAYEKSVDCDFIQAAINAWAIDDDLLLQNNSESMERFTEPPLPIRKFVSWLSDPAARNFEKNDVSVIMLSDLV